MDTFFNIVVLAGRGSIVTSVMAAFVTYRIDVSIMLILIGACLVVVGLIGKDFSAVITERQYEKEGRIVTVTEQTNLTHANYGLNKGDTVRIDFVTPLNPVSVGDVVSFYDTNRCPQVGIVNSINDDNTATIFMNDYAANGTVNVSMQYIYGIVTGRHYDW